MIFKPKDILTKKIKLKDSLKENYEDNFEEDECKKMLSGKCKILEINENGEFAIGYRGKLLLAWLDLEDFEFVVANSI
ncbi:MAG: hypothetical protein M0P61_00445 [Ignavibacteriaceae bacterium]|jgi:hypothetical protein|nr:hypothetical protein [Ignavibacteriaceae bacterium]